MDASKGNTKCMFYVCLFIQCVFVNKLKVDTWADKVQPKRNIWNGARLSTAANALYCLCS